MKQLLLTGYDHLVADSIALLRKHEPPEGYYGCFSGGKDSVVIKELARMSGVKVTWHYNVTTIDPPELVRFIRREHPDVVWEKPKHGNFFKRMEKKGFPSRRGRWCCEEYKERMAPPCSVLILGIRAEESPKRAINWKPVQNHYLTGDLAIQPILYWASDELWAFIRDRKIKYCSLYDEGFYRLGCIGCPLANKANRMKELKRWPGYERKWKTAFQKIYERRTGSIDRNKNEWFGDRYFAWTNNDWRSGGLEWTLDGAWQRMWEWWLSGDSLSKP